MSILEEVQYSTNIGVSLDGFPLFPALIRSDFRRRVRQSARVPRTYRREYQRSGGYDGHDKDFYWYGAILVVTFPTIG